MRIHLKPNWWLLLLIAVGAADVLYEQDYFGHHLLSELRLRHDMAHYNRVATSDYGWLWISGGVLLILAVAERLQTRARRRRR
jgi:hypothetical protein